MFLQNASSRRTSLMGAARASQRRNSRQRVILSSVLTMACLGGSKAYGWGQDAHRIVNQAAAHLMESRAASFFQANTEALGELSLTPDLKWKDRSTYSQEASTHFFQWDVYRTSDLAKTLDKVVFSQAMDAFGPEFVKKNGSAVWRIDQIFHRMVGAIKAKDWVKTLQMAGVLGHYVGDLSQPMHDTKDYDGQSIGRRGIHKYFETDLVKKSHKGELLDRVVSAGGPLRQELDSSESLVAVGGSKVVRMLSVEEGKEGYGELDDVLRHFEGDEPNDEALSELFAPRMGSGAATLARIWDLAVKEAQLEDAPQERLEVDHPEWFPIEDPKASLSSL